MGFYKIVRERIESWGSQKPECIIYVHKIILELAFKSKHVLSILKFMIKYD